uniref:Secreted protein n=1 Tax=Parascaris equorum TaxID=6256 RepID=A0A914RY32_PAREQ
MFFETLKILTSAVSTRLLRTLNNIRASRNNASCLSATCTQKLIAISVKRRTVNDNIPCNILLTSRVAFSEMRRRPRMQGLCIALLLEFGEHRLRVLP